MAAKRLDSADKIMNWILAALALAAVGIAWESSLQAGVSLFGLAVLFWIVNTTLFSPARNGRIGKGRSLVLSTLIFIAGAIIGGWLVTMLPSGPLNGHTTPMNSFHQ